MTRAYFRTLAPRVAPAKAPSVAARTDLVRTLVEDGVIEPAAAPRLLTAAGGDESSALDPLLLRAMWCLAEEAPDVYAQRSEELAYLANVLVAGCTFERRRARPSEAIQVVIAVVNHGLATIAAQTMSGEREDAAVEALRTHAADGIFRMAWSALHGSDIHVDLARVLERASQLGGSIDTVVVHPVPR
jgi:hypothetical protein